MVVWETMPGNVLREACAARCGAGHRKVYDDASEAFEVGGIKIDLQHVDRVALERTLREVTVGEDTDLSKHGLVAALREGVPVHDQNVVSAWKAQAQVYPDGLQRTMIERNLVFGPHWWIEMLAERNDVLFLSDILGRVARATLGIAFALNRHYLQDQSWKWATRVAAGMDLAPAGFATRVERMLSGPPLVGAHLARSLIDESLECVAMHRPDIELTSARSRVQAPRTRTA